MQNLGRIHLYTGSGKGKTTAAVGLVVRLLGRGGTAVFMQFLKGENSGERSILRTLPGLVLPKLPETVRFVFQMSAQEKADYARLVQRQFESACSLAEGCDLLVLDEALGAIEMGLLPLAAVMDYLTGKPKGLELVLTGRSAPEALKAAADYVMRVDSEKHPYDSGVQARQGIEY